MKGSNFVEFQLDLAIKKTMCVINCAVAVFFILHSHFFLSHLLHYFVGSRIFMRYKTEINSLQWSYYRYRISLNPET